MTSPCPYCGRSMILGDFKERHPSRDHIKPKSKSKSVPYNSLTVCVSCNRDKADRTLEEYLVYLIGRSIELKLDLELNERRLMMIDYLVKCGLK